MEIVNKINTKGKVFVAGKLALKKLISEGWKPSLLDEANNNHFKKESKNKQRTLEKEGKYITVFLVPAFDDSYINPIMDSNNVEYTKWSSNLIMIN